MFGTSWRVGRIAGIAVRVDSSWVVIALLITYSMYLRFSILYKSLSTGAAVGVAILAAVLFFAEGSPGAERPMAYQPGAGSYGPARRPSPGAGGCPDGSGDGQARGR
jgi:hypothetical protein